MWNSSSQYNALGQQEVANLVPPEVEHERAPVGVLALAGVGVLVQRGAVEPGQRPIVLREVCRHPVDDHADALGMQRVDEGAEVVGRSVAGRRRVVRRDLVAPRAPEGMLGHRHHLHVGEPELGHVGRELLGQLEVGQRPIAVLGDAPPRADVHLVRGHPLVDGIGARRGVRARPGRSTRSVSSATTTDAVPGGTSVPRAIGSAFSRSRPSAPTTSNLYLQPGATSGTKSSQTPDEPSERIG